MGNVYLVCSHDNEDMVIQVVNRETWDWLIKEDPKEPCPLPQKSAQKEFILKEFGAEEWEFQGGDEAHKKRLESVHDRFQEVVSDDGYDTYFQIIPLIKEVSKRGDTIVDECHMVMV